MQRLRHPIRAIREPFGKAGLTVAILALVMAMVGGAYAAGGLTKSQEKQVTKIAKKYAGKPGAAGTNGTNGTNGAPGAKGEPGAAGTNGKDGVSVTSSSFSGNEHGCPKGGSQFVSASGETFACNGKEGTPWTAGGTLPVGSTETGTWMITASSPKYNGEFPSATLSFPIQLAGELGQEQTHVVTGAEQSAHTAPQACQGTAAEPTAESGNLCVYLDGETEKEFVLGLTEKPVGKFENGPLGAGIAGAIVISLVNEPGTYAQGTWAVTG